MKITLSKIRHQKSLSDETPCFTANVLLDGKVAFTVQNRGCGGANIYQAIGKNPQEIADSQEKIDRYHLFSPNDKLELDWDLESYILTLVYLNEMKQTLRSRLKNHVMMIENDTLFSLKVSKGIVVDTAIPAAMEKYPNATILNSMPFDDAVEAILAPDPSFADLKKYI